VMIAGKTGSLKQPNWSKYVTCRRLVAEGRGFSRGAPRFA
jgi:hypothetical protein